MPVQENERYGKLITQKIIGKTKNRNKLWQCKCDCGNIINVPSGSLTTGNTKSCGCLHTESIRKSGEKLRLLNEYDLSSDYGIGYTSKGEPFYFDLEDYDKIKNYTWRYNPDGYLISLPFGELIRMHMLVMNSDGSHDVDHINHIKYDNRKDNLRICERYQNITHSKTRKDNTSGRKGVYWDKARYKWMAVLTYNKRVYHLGRFDTFEEAVEARKLAESEYHKEFACNL
jgi:hypothetical protein